MINRDSRILVTGSTGMIGRSLVMNLKSSGYRNIIVPTKNDLNLFSKEDIKDFFLKNQPEVIILASGKTGGIKDNIDNSSSLIIDNLMMQNNIFFNLQHVKDLKRLFFFASSCIYPKDINEPMKEDEILSGMPESSSISYAMAKLSGIYSCKSLNVKYKKNICISVIPASCYGPYDNFDPVSSHVLSGIMRKMIEKKFSNSDEILLWGSGKVRREFIYVDDLSKAILHLLPKETLTEILNIGVGEDFTINKLAHMIAETVNFNGKILWDNKNPDGASRKLLDSREVFKMNWSPRINLSEGLSLTYNWLMKNGEFIK